LLLRKQRRDARHDRVHRRPWPDVRALSHLVFDGGTSESRLPVERGRRRRLVPDAGSERVLLGLGRPRHGGHLFLRWTGSRLLGAKGVLLGGRDLDDAPRRRSVTLIMKNRLALLAVLVVAGAPACSFRRWNPGAGGGGGGTGGGISVPVTGGGIGSSGGSGRAAACVASGDGTACASCASQACGDALSGVDGACADYFSCVCPGAVFSVVRHLVRRWLRDVRRARRMPHVGPRRMLHVEHGRRERRSLLLCRRGREPGRGRVRERRRRVVRRALTRVAPG
jgi:hypothetical protein